MTCFMLKAVIFDMDGVLVDSEPIYYEIEKKNFRKLGLKISEREHLSFKGMTGKGMWSLLKKKYGLPQPLNELILSARKITLERMAVEKNLKPILGVVPLLSALKRHGVKLLLATSASKECMDLLLAVLKLGQYFEHKVCAADVEHGKPAPDIFLAAAKRAGVHPMSCIVFEDSRNGVLAAKRAGMKCIGYDDSAIKQDLSSADLIIDSFDKINYRKLLQFCA